MKSDKAVGDAAKHSLSATLVLNRNKVLKGMELPLFCKMQLAHIFCIITQQLKVDETGIKRTETSLCSTKLSSMICEQLPQRRWLHFFKPLEKI